MKNQPGDSARRQYACDQKRCYTTWHDAEHVASMARRKGRNAGVILVPFSCRYCPCYHLASADSVRREATRRSKRRRIEDYGDDE